MELILRIQEQLIDLNERGKIIWLSAEQGEQDLLEDHELYFEVLMDHSPLSKLVSFLLKGKIYHYMIYFTDLEMKKQESARFYWDVEKKLC